MGQAQVAAQSFGARTQWHVPTFIDVRTRFQKSMKKLNEERVLLSASGSEPRNELKVSSLVLGIVLSPWFY